MNEISHGITHRRVLKIAIPIVLANATVPLIGVVDTGVVGQIGLAAPIGAVGIGAIILSAVYWIFGFLRMGTTGLASQAYGAGHTGEVAALLTRSLIIGLAGGFAVITLQAPLFFMGFQLSPASEEVEALAREYMAIRVWSAPAIISTYGITGWLIAKERTAAVFALQFLMNFINVILDLLFVIDFGWGVEGVAWASFLAECCGFIFGLWLCRDVLWTKTWRDWPRVFDRGRLVLMASVNRDILIRSIIIQMTFVMFLFVGSDFSDVTLAANQILLQFLYVTSYALDGFAFSAEALVGQAFGARNLKKLRRGAVLSSYWGFVLTFILSAGFALFGEELVALMAKSEEVRIEAAEYLGWMVLAPFTGVAAWMLDGVFIGATRARDMRNMMALSFLIYILALVILVPLMQNHGLWLALLISFIARAASLGIRYPALEAAVSTKEC
ncbi:MAG: MATE family efflux transporter [Roseovarius sp.]|nr:MATE family efflux transporter [Roseovarius sp.]